MLAIKKAYAGEFRHFLSILRLAMLDNRLFVAFPKKKFTYLTILKQLQKQGFIESYEERPELVVVSLKQTYWKSSQLPLHAFSNIELMRCNKYKTGTVRQITQFYRTQGQFVECVLSTDNGVTSGLKALAIKTGGIPLFKIY